MVVLHLWAENQVWASKDPQVPALDRAKLQGEELLLAATMMLKSMLATLTPT